MSGDPRLAFAKGWLHRAVSAGLSAADFLEVTDPIERWEDWCPAWCVRGAAYEEAALTAQAQGRTVSAGQLLRRASLCFHFANNLYFVDRAAARTAHERSIRCNDAALPFLDDECARVAIPYEGGSLPGILRRPKGALRPPLVLMVNGIDSTKEEFELRQREFADRGVATLLFDGPGQGEAQYDRPIRGDFEVPARAAIDHATRAGGIDADRIGVFGISLGGYYAARAAAFDARIKACIALSGPYDLAESWPNMGPLHREAIRIRSHLATEEEARRHAASLTLKGVAERIVCPLYVATGTRDYFAYEQAERLAAEAKGPVRRAIVENRPHVPDDRDYRYRTDMVDWMTAQLGAAAGGATHK